jgi:hypothetical protein
MKLHLSSIAAVIFIQARTSGPRLPQSIDQTIYNPAPPFVDLKQSIYVHERERPLLPLVADASNSLVLFLMDITNDVAVANIRQVMDKSRSLLRLPPHATFGDSRFVDAMVYCWTSDNPEQLEFLVEWGDITTNARYTDSYVFIRHAGSWYFAKHGTVAPWRWTKTQRYFRRACPVPLNVDAS